MLHGCRLGLRLDFSKVDEWRCRDPWWWSSQPLDEEVKECCTVKLGKRAVRSYHVGHEIFGIQNELMDLWYSCSVTVATESQNVIDHSKRRSVASKHVGLRGLWLHEALVDGKLELEKADTAITLLTCVPKRCLETESATCVGDDPNEWYQSRLHELCRSEKFERSRDAESEGRVDFPLLLCCNQTHFASAVGHEPVDPLKSTAFYHGEGFM